MMMYIYIYIHHKVHVSAWIPTLCKASELSRHSELQLFGKWCKQCLCHQARFTRAELNIEAPGPENNGSIAGTHSK
jgi:hypothetical protein